MYNKTNPHDDCAKVLETLKSSGLVYHLSETPYSAYITVRKKYIKENIYIYIYINPENS